MKDFSASSSPNLMSYVESTFRPQDDALQEIRDRSEKRGLPPIHVGAMDGRHLEVLVRASGARKIVEVGTLAGYSGVCICRGMGPDGRLYTLEVDRLHAEVARETFERNGFSRQVEILIGPGNQGLAKLTSLGPFDLIFIDADKTGYPDYFRWAEANLRVGGLLVADNTLGWGMIHDTSFEDDETRQKILALREFNQLAAQSSRFRSTLLPTGEGLTVAVKIQ